MNRRMVGVLLMFCGVACARQALVIEPHAAPRPDAPQVVVLKGQATPLFDAAISSFIKRCGAQVTVFANVGDVKSAELAAAVHRVGPALIFTLGTPAIAFAAKTFPDTPILFAMALNYGALHKDRAANIMGIAAEPAPVSEFAKFRMIDPELHRVAVAFTEGSTDAILERAREDVRQLDVELVPIAVPPGGDAAAAYNSRGQDTDALWLMDDPDIMRQFEALKRASLTQRKPLLASLSDSFARAGALMAVSIDAESIGTQAATITRRVLDGSATVGDIGVQRPIAVRLVVNAKVAAILGMRIPEDVLPYINEIIQAPSSP